MFDSRKTSAGTAAKLAQIFGTEGWSDRLSNMCDNFIHRSNVKSAHKVRRRAEIEEAWGKIAPKLDTAERLVLGRFIGMHKEVAFEAGLRTGLGVSIHELSEVSDEG